MEILKTLWERIKLFFTSPAFWKLVGGGLILFARQVFPELNVSDEDLMKVFGLFILAVFGIDLELTKQMLRMNLGLIQKK